MGRADCGNAFSNRLWHCKAVKGRGEYAGMDNCHARDQCAAGAAGHGKSFFSGEEVSLRQSSRPKRKIPRRRRWSGMLLLFGSLQTAFMDYPTEKTI